MLDISALPAKLLRAGMQQPGEQGGPAVAKEGEQGEELGECTWIRGESSFESWELRVQCGLKGLLCVEVDGGEKAGLPSLSFLVGTAEEGGP